MAGGKVGGDAEKLLVVPLPRHPKRNRSQSFGPIPPESNTHLKRVLVEQPNLEKALLDITIMDVLYMQ